MSALLRHSITPLLHCTPLAMLFRLVAVSLIGFLLHRNQLRSEAEGQRPIRLSEVRTFLPAAHRLALNSGPEGGLRVFDANRELIGFAQRTMPQCREIRGYSGPSDVLLVFDAGTRLKGIHFRHSYDTPSHVEDVAKSYSFMEQWNGKTRREIAAQAALPVSKFHVVSGASRTSEAVARSVTLRSAGQAASPPGFSLRWQDLALMACILLGVGLAGLHKPLLQRHKTWIHLAMVIYLGLVSADLLAQSLLFSWAAHGIPWRTLPGLAMLAAAAFLIPWSTGKPVYCTHLCPHGHLQRWLMKLIPPRRKLILGNDEKWSFALLPVLILAAALIIAFRQLPIDLAGFEPFDAWSIKGIGLATAIIFVLSLAFSLFVPMGYCRYGCPTGKLLELVRKDPDGFRRRDGWLLFLAALSAALYFSGGSG